MLAYIFVILAFASRFMPHPWHFTPVAASLLFFGAHASRRRFLFPVALLALSDVILTKYVYGVSFQWDHFVTWAWYVAVLLLGTRLRDNAKPWWIAASAAASSVSFFLVSNFAVWACYDMYPKTFAGLMTSYAAGIPFFQRGLAGDLIYTVVLFSVPVLLHLPRTLRQRSGNLTA